MSEAQCKLCCDEARSSVGSGQGESVLVPGVSDVVETVHLQLQGCLAKKGHQLSEGTAMELQLQASSVLTLRHQESGALLLILEHTKCSLNACYIQE